MTAFDTYFPFDTGPGANSGQERWRKMARLWCDGGVARGVGDEFAFQSWDPGYFVVRSGGAFVNGFYGEIGISPVSWIGLQTPGDAGLIKARFDPVNSNMQLLFEAWYGMHEDPNGYFEVPIYQLNGHPNYIDRRRRVPIEQEYGLAEIPRWVPRGYSGGQWYGPAAQTDVLSFQTVHAAWIEWNPGGFTPGRHYRVSATARAQAFGQGPYGMDLLINRASDGAEIGRRSMIFDWIQTAGAHPAGWADMTLWHAENCLLSIQAITQIGGVTLRFQPDSCRIQIEDIGADE